MIRFQAINNVVIIRKDSSVPDSPLILPEVKVNNPYDIPEPYTGVIDSVGMENEWKSGDRVAFEGMGGIYMKVDDSEYVVVLPDMIMGKYE